MKARFLALVGLVASMLFAAVTARAADAEIPAASPNIVFLPGSARAIPRTTSASRDAAVIEAAYGPRAQLSAGAEPGLLFIRGANMDARIGGYALIALENARSADFVPPTETWRDAVGLSLALDMKTFAARVLPRGSHLELGVSVGRDAAGADNANARLPPLAARDIPFGAGGDFIAPDVAWSMLSPDRSHAVTLTMRLTDRMYLSALPLVTGDRTAADAAADSLHEAFTNAVSVDVIARWHMRSWAEPELALYAEHAFSHDAFTADAAYFRAMAKLVLPGKYGELSPFLSFDAGNGQGALVNRRELRSSFGARYAFF